MLSCQHSCGDFSLENYVRYLFTMPITVKDFEWEQSEQMLYIRVPLKGIAKNKVDILSTEVYIKVSV